MTLAADRPVIPAARYRERLERARDGLAGRGAAALLVGVGSDLRYLTGYAAMQLERLTMLVLGRSGGPQLIAPRLEAMAAAASPAAAAGLVDVVAWDETDDAHAVAARLLSGLTKGAATGDRVLVSLDLWALHVLGLQAHVARPFGLATEVMRELRMAKDPDEVELLRLAAHAADRVVAALAAGPLVGRTERSISLEIADRLVAEGHDEGRGAIVGSGPNSASPHHHAGDRVIEAGEPLVLDLGGPLGGYASDTTRTFWVAGPEGIEPPAEFLRIYDLVRESNRQATEAVRPGIACGALDGIARAVISEGGYGPAFLHRLGHGIGLDVHEEPYLVGDNDEALREGIAFSIEPGIYLADRFGVRIEDIVVCARSGPDVLNEFPRDLQVVRG